MTSAAAKLQTQEAAAHCWLTAAGAAWIQILQTKTLLNGFMADNSDRVQLSLHFKTVLCFTLRQTAERPTHKEEVSLIWTTVISTTYSCRALGKFRGDFVKTKSYIEDVKLLFFCWSALAQIRKNNESEICCWTGGGLQINFLNWSQQLQSVSCIFYYYDYLKKKLLLQKVTKRRLMSKILKIWKCCHVSSVWWAPVQSNHW